MFAGVFEVPQAVLSGGFEPGKGLREGHGRKVFFVERNFAPTWGKRPEYKIGKALLNWIHVIELK